MACNDEKAIEKVKGELEEEGLTPDEAARLIQSVFRKVRASKLSILLLGLFKI